MHTKELTPGVSSAKAAVWDLKDRPDVSGYHHENGVGSGLRVRIVDDHPCIQAHLESALGAVSEVDALFRNGGPDPDRLHPATHGHDIVLVGTCGAIRDESLELISAIRSSDELARVALLACAMAPESVTRALRSGVDGIVSRHLDSEEFAMAVRLIHRGQRVVSGCFRDKTEERDEPSYDLTSDELQILKLVATGYHIREIGSEMLMAASTLKRSMRSIRSKLKVRTTSEALVAAARSGLV